MGVTTSKKPRMQPRRYTCRWKVGDVAKAGNERVRVTAVHGHTVIVKRIHGSKEGQYSWPVLSYILKPVENQP